MGNPHLSVVIPVYNGERYLEKAVTSVLDQPYKDDINIVLVDDGSTDGSSQLCDELDVKFDRVHVIHKANGGVSSARNVGIDYVLNTYGADGYIAFLDADDAWVGGFFDEEIVSLLCAGYDILSFQSCLCNEKMTKRSQPLNRKEGVFEGGIKNIEVGARQHFASMFYSIKLFLNFDIRFPVVKFCEDKMFRFRAVYLADEIFLKNKLLYLYRNNGKSLVHTRPFGIEYYPTIIDAYLDLDAEMEMWSDESRGKLEIGRSYALQYTMEMQEEHYFIGGTPKEFKCFCEQNPQYSEMLADAGLEESYQSFMNPSTHYIWKQRIRGALWKIARYFSYVPCVSKMLDQVRYPIDLQ